MEENCAQILIEGLEKKDKILDRILEEDDRQETLLKAEPFDLDAFEETIDAQNRLTVELEQQDKGFEALYDRLRQDLLDNRAAYSVQIARMQELISQITDKVVTINAANLRIRQMTERQFAMEKETIRQGITTSKVAKGYYNNMNNLNYVAPQFYDSKK